MARSKKKEMGLRESVRAQAIASVKRYFAEELEHEIGDLKAALVLDFFVAEIGPAIYNDAIGEARAFFEERAADLESVQYQKEFSYWPR